MTSIGLLRTHETQDECDQSAHEWNEDDRLVSAKLEQLDGKAVIHSEEHEYWYDHVGRRIPSELPDDTLIASARRNYPSFSLF